MSIYRIASWVPGTLNNLIFLRDWNGQPPFFSCEDVQSFNWNQAFSSEDVNWVPGKNKLQLEEGIDLIPYVNQTPGWILFVFRGNTQTWNHHLLKSQRVLYTLYFNFCYLSKVSTSLEFFLDTKRATQLPPVFRQVTQGGAFGATGQLRLSNHVLHVTEAPLLLVDHGLVNNKKKRRFPRRFTKCVVLFRHIGEPLVKKKMVSSFSFSFSDLRVPYIYLEPGVLLHEILAGAWFQISGELEDQCFWNHWATSSKFETFFKNRPIIS